MIPTTASIAEVMYTVLNGISNITGMRTLKLELITKTINISND